METDGTSYLEGLYDRFNKIAINIQQIHGRIDATKPSTINTALEDLNSVLSQLVDLQEYQKGLPVNAITGDVSNAIAKEISELLEQTKALHSQLTTIAGRLNEGSNVGSDKNADINDSSKLSDAPALTRDELGKLFLLTAKAYSIKAISLEQRNKIKGEIIMQKGYLRDLLLKSTDIAAVLSTMSSFPV